MVDDYKVGDKVKVIRSDRIGTVEKFFHNEDFSV